MNRNDRAITGLVMVAHAMVHTYELSLPLLLPVWQAEFSTVALPTGTLAVTGFVMGVVLTMGYAPFGLGALPGGVLADAYGSRRLILSCLVGMGVSFLLLAVSPGLVAIAFALFVWGVAASVYHPSGLALISKGVEERGSAFAYHGVAGNLGIALGPLATALLLFGLGDWRVVVGLLALPALVAAIAAARIDVDETAAVGSETATDGGTDDGDESENGAGEDDAPGGDARASGSVSSLGEFLADSRLLFGGAFVLVFAAVMLSGLYYRGLLTFLPEILGRFPSLAPVEFAGRTLEPERYFYVGLLMVGVAGQYAGGRLTDRVPVELGLLGGYGALAVLAVLFLPVATMGLVPLLVMGALVGFFLFVVQPFYQATVAEYTPAGARGLSYGYTYLGVFGVGALGGAVAGGVLTYANDAALFAVLAGFGALAALCGAVLYVRR
ncbi:MFS transporter [Haloglomus halophilum]|uniref:MFS transporter n=1 Tax=Haloglomus halophilum TaxID=2962672 RepID=UPI0020C9B99D|nr:MFS transporter [Haloglomus halophilum]